MFAARQGGSRSDDQRFVSRCLNEYEKNLRELVARLPKQLWDLYEGVSITLPKVPEDMASHQSLMDRWVNTFHGVDKANMRDRDALYRQRRLLMKDAMNTGKRARWDYRPEEGDATE